MVGEGDGSTGITVTGRLIGALSNSTTVSVWVGAGGDSATEGTDYTTVNDFTLTIGAGQMKGTRTFNLIRDRRRSDRGRRDADGEREYD